MRRNSWWTRPFPKRLKDKSMPKDDRRVWAHTIPPHGVLWNVWNVTNIEIRVCWMKTIKMLCKSESQIYELHALRLLLSFVLNFSKTMSACSGLRAYGPVAGWKSNFIVCSLFGHHNAWRHFSLTLLHFEHFRFAFNWFIFSRLTQIGNNVKVMRMCVCVRVENLFVLPLLVHTFTRF